MARRLRATADDRLLNDPLGRIQGRDAIVEGRDVATFVRSRPAAPGDNLTQLGTIGQDTKVDRQAVSGPRLVGPAMSPASTGPDQACGPLQGVTPDDVEDKDDSATSSTD